MLPRTVLAVAFLLATLALVAVPAAAQPGDASGPMRAGEVEAIDVSLGGSAETSHTEVVSHPGASVMMVHLDQLALAPGVELVVSDGDKSLSHRYPGAGANRDSAGEWALGVAGDTVLLTLQVADSSLARDLSSSGVHVDRYAWGYPLSSPESVCGADDRDDVECYSTSHPTEFERARAVARHYRIESPYVWLCTAWRVGPGATMFTNEHCLEEGQPWLDASQFYFNYERTVCHGGTIKPPTVVTGDTLLIKNAVYDFALFTINNPSAVAQYGYLELDVRSPVLHEQVYMAGHPNGDPKKFALESDMNTSGFCEIDAVNHPWAGAAETGYYCDSSGGQSGSPLLARSTHKVLALHHAGYDPCGGDAMNLGVKMQYIWPWVADYLPWIFENGFESGDTSAWSLTVP